MKRLLILYGFEHSGHHAAALALQDAFREMRPDLDIVLLNYFLYASRILERFSTRVFFRMIKSTPRLWDRIYRNPLSEERFTRFRQFVRSWASRGPDDLVREYAPDAIVCTQSFACGMINDFKGGRRAGIPLYAALTDYSVPPYWLYDRIDRYFVASPEARSLLVGQGVDGARVLDSGIPIRLCFQSLPSREKARRILGIASPRPMVMIMGGWSGWGALDRLAMEIQRLNRDADIVVVAGRNREMHRALTRHASMPGSRLRVLEYVDRVDLLMRAADVLVGKAGGMTSAEALAAGLPAVLVHILPGQERANASFLCGHGAAVAATGPANAAAIVARLIHEPSLREAMSLSACAVARPGAASTIVRSVLEGAHASLYCV